MANPKRARPSPGRHRSKKLTELRNFIEPRYLPRMILNRQRTVRVARPPLELFLRRVREKLGLEGAEVTICLVSDAEIARMNESFRKKPGPPDVLSFPAPGRRKPVSLRGRNGHATLREGTASAVAKRAIERGALAPESTPEFLGDIAISPATARRNAKKFNRPLPNCKS